MAYTSPWGNEDTAPLAGESISVVDPGNDNAIATWLSIVNVEPDGGHNLKISWDGGATFAMTLTPGQPFSISARMSNVWVQSDHSDGTDYQWSARGGSP